MKVNYFWAIACLFFLSNPLLSQAQDSLPQMSESEKIISQITKEKPDSIIENKDGRKVFYKWFENAGSRVVYSEKQSKPYSIQLMVRTPHFHEPYHFFEDPYTKSPDFDSEVDLFILKLSNQTRLSTLKDLNQQKMFTLPERKVSFWQKIVHPFRSLKRWGNGPT